LRGSVPLTVPVLRSNAAALHRARDTFLSPAYAGTARVFFIIKDKNNGRENSPPFLFPHSKVASEATRPLEGQGPDCFVAGTALERAFSAAPVGDPPGGAGYSAASFS
jgi:hypothetical protein